MDKDAQARAVYHLQGWGIWRRIARGTATRGYPSKSAGVESGGGSEEFDALVEREDAKAAAICDRVIDDLGVLYRTRLESEYITQGVFKSNRHNNASLLMDAQAAFWAKAKRLLT